METFVKINAHIEHKIKVCLNFSVCVKILQNLILCWPLKIYLKLLCLRLSSQVQEKYIFLGCSIKQCQWFLEIKHLM